MPTSTTSGGIVSLGTPGEAEQQAADDQQDRIGEPQRPRQDQQPRTHDEQQEKLQLLLGAEIEDHAVTLGGSSKGAPWTPIGHVSCWQPSVAASSARLPVSRPKTMQSRTTSPTRQTGRPISTRTSSTRVARRTFESSFPPCSGPRN